MATSRKQNTSNALQKMLDIDRARKTQTKGRESVIKPGRIGYPVQRKQKK